MDTFLLETGVYTKGSFEIPGLLQQIMSRVPKEAGALATFTGVTKVGGKDNKAVSKLEMQSYEAHANKVLQKICAEVQTKFGVSLVKIYHFIGEFEIGEPIVFAVVAGVNRKEVFPALQEAVERYKREPALWKREFYADGSHEWIAHA